MPSKLARALAALVLLVAVTTSAEPRELDPRARHHLERGVKAFEEGRYAEAAKAFETGHRIDPHPVFYFPWAEAVRRSGDCAKAVPLYEKALETAKTSESRRMVRKPLSECEAIAAREGEDALRAAAEAEAASEPPERPPPERTLERPAPAPPPVRPSLPPARAGTPKRPPRPRKEGRPFYLDPVGDVFAGAAVASAALALVSYGSASRHEQAARVADLDAWRREVHAADRDRLIAVVAISAAGAAGVAALLRFWAVSADDTRTVSAAADAHGGVLVIGGRF